MPLHLPDDPGPPAMIRVSELKLPLDHAPEALPALAAGTLGIAEGDIAAQTVYKRSFDARKAELRVVYIVDVALADGAHEAALLARHTGNPHIQRAPDMEYRPPAQASDTAAPRPIVVGFGPCGMFCALLLAQMGFKPIVLERGKPVRERTQDTWALWRKSKLDPESNVQFGEGGAGTFSDGKLYSQIKDPRFFGRKVMHEFVRAGAPPEILYVAQPHIGTFRLVKVVENMREQIIALGGEVRFGAARDRPADRGRPGCAASPCATSERRDQRAARRSRGAGAGPQLARHLRDAARARRVHRGQAVRDRLSHRASAVADRSRALGPVRGPPAARRRRLQARAPREQRPLGLQLLHVPGRHGGGGHLRAGPRGHQRHEPVFAQRAQRQRGHRGRHRAARFPGLDIRRNGDALAGIALQRALESKAFELGGGDYRAPAQLVGDFVRGAAVERAGRGRAVVQARREARRPARRRCPAYAIDAIREALPVFGRKIQGFDLHDAVLTGVETRTSSPVRITRGDDLQSLNVRGLYPCGEGAGYAGGILSAGVDGIKVAEAVAASLLASRH